MNPNINITRLKGDLTGILHGTTFNQVTNIYGLFNRAASQLLLDVNPQETKRTVPIVNAIYSNVFYYPMPVDLKGVDVINIAPQVIQQSAYPGNQFSQLYASDFNYSTWLTNCGPYSGSFFNISFNSGVKSFNINWSNAPTAVLVNPADQTNDNGVWNVGGDATALTTDNVNFVAGNGSLQFNLTGATGIGYLENTSSAAVDLTQQLNQGSLFLYTYLPTGTDFSSVTLWWGNDSGNYWTQTATLTQQNTAFQNGWNLLQFPWISATPVGSPDASQITYLRITWNYTMGVPQTAVRLDNIISALGSIMTTTYYSKYLFSNPSTHAWQELVLTDSDLINLDTESYPLYLYLCAAFCVQQQSGAESDWDSNEFWGLYQKAKLRYTTMYKSEVKKPATQYYKPPMMNLRKYFRGRGW